VNKLKAMFFCCLLLLVFFFFSFPCTNTVFADEIDDLLDKCKVAPNPKPSAMVYNYKLNPETLMPGDVGILTITLKNTQDKPIERDIDIKESEYQGRTIDIDTETRFTMDAYIKEAHIVEREFEVYNKYVAAGVIGPNEKIDLAFKIKAPFKEGIYMLKFVADIEDMKGKSSKGIRYFIPIVVTGTVNILPQEVSENEVRLEVINEGLSDVNGVYVIAVSTASIASGASGAKCPPEKIYIGKIKSGESAIAVFNFNVNKAENEAWVENTNAVFKAIYKNGINKHESNQICVMIPCWNCGEEKREEGEPLLEEHSETSFSTLSSTPTPTHTRASSFSSALKLPGFVAVFTFAGLLVVAVAFAFAFAFAREKRKRKGRGDGEERRK